MNILYLHPFNFINKINNSYIIIKIKNAINMKKK